MEQLASFRRLVYDHIRHGMMLLLDDLERSGGCLSEENMFNAQHVANADKIYHGEPFPTPLYAALSYLWDDPSIQAAWEQSSRPKCVYPSNWRRSTFLTGRRSTLAYLIFTLLSTASSVPTTYPHIKTSHTLQQQTERCLKRSSSYLTQK